MIVGNDISHYQGTVDFDIYKNNSNFVIIKATEGVDFIDDKLGINQKGFRKTNLPLGYYHFARPDKGNSALTEAHHFINSIGDLLEGEFLALDYECPNQQQSHVQWCLEWLTYIKEAMRIKPFVYLNQSIIEKFNWQSVVDKGYALWVAAYTGGPNNNNFNTGQWPRAAMQQWTNKQQVPGVSGNIDGDVFFGDATALKKYGWQPIQLPTDPTPPNDDIVKRLNVLEANQRNLQDDLRAVQSLQGSHNIKINENQKFIEKLKNL